MAPDPGPAVADAELGDRVLAAISASSCSPGAMTGSAPPPPQVRGRHPTRLPRRGARSRSPGRTIVWRTGPSRRGIRSRSMRSRAGHVARRCAGCRGRSRRRDSRLARGLRLARRDLRTRRNVVMRGIVLNALRHGSFGLATGGGHGLVRAAVRDQPVRLDATTGVAPGSPRLHCRGRGEPARQPDATSGALRLGPASAGVRRDEHDPRRAAERVRRWARAALVRRCWSAARCRRRTGSRRTARSSGISGCERTLRRRPAARRSWSSTTPNDCQRRVLAGGLADPRPQLGLECRAPSRSGCAGRPGSARRRAGARRARAPRAPAAVTRPPGLRKILASPGSRPSIRSGSIRESMQVTIAMPACAMPSKPARSKCVGERTVGCEQVVEVVHGRETLAVRPASAGRAQWPRGVERPACCARGGRARVPGRPATTRADRRAREDGCSWAIPATRSRSDERRAPGLAVADLRATGASALLGVVAAQPDRGEGGDADQHADHARDHDAARWRRRARRRRCWPAGRR